MERERTSTLLLRHFHKSIAQNFLLTIQGIWNRKNALQSKKKFLILFPLLLIKAIEVLLVSIVVGKVSFTYPIWYSNTDIVFWWHLAWNRSLTKVYSSTQIEAKLVTNLLPIVSFFHGRNGPHFLDKLASLFRGRKSLHVVA